MKQRSILIVGAGPVGLSAAYFISLIPNIKIQIVQKYPLNDRQVFSKALNINSRTMQLFSKSDIQAEFLQQSFKITKFRICTKQKLIVQNDIEKTLQKKTRFPAMHIFPQTLTERTIQKQLNKRKIFVQRQKQVISVKNLINAKSESVLVEIQDNGIDKGGQITRKQYDLVLATDGAHSTIRKMFGLKFQGQTLPTSIYLCDAQIQSQQPIVHSQTIIDGQNFVIMIPIRPGYVRFMGNSPNYLLSIPSTKLKILSQRWRSQFTINNRIISQMSIGQVYFAGDAAHVHAPLGNRGMNLGIEDVYVFAKLLQQGKQKKYNQIRYETVKKFVLRVNDLSKKAFTYEQNWSKRLLTFMGPVINQILKNDILLFVTGLDYQLPQLAKL